MTGKTFPQLAAQYNREVRQARTARAISRAWAWLFAVFLVLVALNMLRKALWG